MFLISFVEGRWVLKSFLSHFHQNPDFSSCSVIFSRTNQWVITACAFSLNGDTQRQSLWLTKCLTQQELRAIKLVTLSMRFSCFLSSLWVHLLYSLSPIRTQMAARLHYLKKNKEIFFFRIFKKSRTIFPTRQNFVLFVFIDLFILKKKVTAEVLIPMSILWCSGLDFHWVFHLTLKSLTLLVWYFVTSYQQTFLICKGSKYGIWQLLITNMLFFAISGYLLINQSVPL